MNLPIAKYSSEIPKSLYEREILKLYEPRKKLMLSPRSKKFVKQMQRESQERKVKRKKILLRLNHS
jgi:hypothetical protein